jgi:TAG lipase/steryl ester hydrolase/phospholipase A2/LPA acyltransferase
MVCSVRRSRQESSEFQLTQYTRAASCSVPGVFTPASLLAKDAKTGIATPWNQSPQRWVDGSIEGDIPTTRISEMFNVNHFIVSQVNPHVVPFLVEEQGPLSAQLRYSDSVVEAGPGWLHGISNLAKNEALHRMHVLSELGVLPNVLTKISSLLSQRYSVCPVPHTSQHTSR